MRLQCVKHLQTKIRPIAPYLAIFGSLNPRVLFPVSKAFEHIFYVPGPTVKPYNELHDMLAPYSNIRLMQRDWFILPKEQVCILGATCASDGSKNAVVNYDQYWVNRELQLDRNMDTILLTYFKIPVKNKYAMYMYAEDIPKYLPASTIEEEDHMRYSDLFYSVRL
jgi:hypothetical protein